MDCSLISIIAFHTPDGLLVATSRMTPKCGRLRWAVFRLRCGSVSKWAIQAGPHERVHWPVAAQDAVGAAAEGTAALSIEGGKRDAPLQRAEGDQWCVLPYLAAGSTERAEVVAGAADAGSGVRIADRGTHLEVTVDGARWGDYHYAAHPVRSYLHPVIGPYGIPMTRAWPLQDGVPGEEHDHVHHRSFWVAHGMVNGVDFWTEAEGHGFQAHGGFDALHSGPAFGRIVQRVSWRKDDPATGTPLLEERRTLTFWNSRPARACWISPSRFTRRTARSRSATPKRAACAPCAFPRRSRASAAA